MRDPIKQAQEYLDAVGSAHGLLGHFHMGPGGTALHCLDEVDMAAWLALNLDDDCDNPIEYLPLDQFGMAHDPPVVVRCALAEGPTDYVFLPPDAATRISTFVFEHNNPHAYN
jgi:hypothetical protein